MIELTSKDKAYKEISKKAEQDYASRKAIDILANVEGIEQVGESLGNADPYSRIYGVSFLTYDNFDILPVIKLLESHGIEVGAHYIQALPNIEGGHFNDYTSTRVKHKITVKE